MENNPTWHTVLEDVSLTERELEILRLKAQRRTNAEIADQLFISLTTVKWYVRQIYNKLGVNNRTELIAAAKQYDLLEPPPDKPKRPLRTIPTPPTPFVGRKQETDNLITLLTNPNNRLVTVMGSGGMGKSRLALHVADRLNGHFDQAQRRRFPDGILWVTFSARDDTEFVFSTAAEYIAVTLATTFGLSLHGVTDPRQHLAAHLQDKDILFVLDSFECLLSGTALISNLLTYAPACKFLITSRERLNIPGETLFAIQGLDEDADAVALFMQTAVHVSNNTYLGSTEQPAIKRICQQLEGMPLAIELAAEWTRLLPITDIEKELDRGLEFLETNATSIRTVIDHSWNLLTEEQRRAFARLSVFQNGFTRDAAEQVANANLNILSALFDKSLIQRIDEDRYTIHDLLRQYAAQQLTTNEHQSTTRDAHCAYFATLAASQVESLVRGDHSKLLADLDNLRTAWKWAVERRRLEDIHHMLFPLDWFYDLRAYYTEGEAVMRLAVEALHMPEPIGLQGIVYGRALTAYGLKQHRVHGLDLAEPTVRHGIEILRRLDAGDDLAWSQILSVYLGVLGHDPQEREQLCQESLTIFEVQNNPYGIAFALTVLGIHQQQLGQFSEAHQSIERSLAVSRSLDNPEGVAQSLRHLGHLNLHMGNYASAHQNFQEEYDLWNNLSLPRLASEALRSLGETFLAEGDFANAESALLKSLSEFEQIGDKGNAVLALQDLTQMALVQNQPQAGRRFLQDVRPIIEQRQDSKEQIQWWQLSGRVYLQLGDLKAANLDFYRALDDALQAHADMLIEVFLDFASLAYCQSDIEKSARLLGFVQAQNQLPAPYIQYRVEPLHLVLSTKLDETLLTPLLNEGADLPQKAVITMLLAYPPQS